MEAESTNDYDFMDAEGTNDCDDSDCDNNDFDDADCDDADRSTIDFDDVDFDEADCEDPDKSTEVDKAAEEDSAANAAVQRIRDYACDPLEGGTKGGAKHAAGRKRNEAAAILTTLQAINTRLERLEEEDRGQQRRRPKRAARSRAAPRRRPKQGISTSECHRDDAFEALWEALAPLLPEGAQLRKKLCERLGFRISDAIKPATRAQQDKAEVVNDSGSDEDSEEVEDNQRTAKKRPNNWADLFKEPGQGNKGKGKGKTSSGVAEPTFRYKLSAAGWPKGTKVTGTESMANLQADVPAVVIVRTEKGWSDAELRAQNRAVGTTLVWVLAPTEADTDVFVDSAKGPVKKKARLLKVGSGAPGQVESTVCAEIDDLASGNNVDLAVVRLSYVKEFADVAHYDEATKDINRLVPKLLGESVLEKILRVKRTACYKEAVTCLITIKAGDKDAVLKASRKRSSDDRA